MASQWATWLGSISLFVVFVLLAYSFHKSRKKKKIMPIVINHMAHKFNVPFIGVLVSVKSLGEGRKMYTYAPRFMDPYFKGKIENVEQIVGENKDKIRAKGTVDAERDVIELLPERVEDFHNSLSEDFMGVMRMFQTEHLTKQNVKERAIRAGRLAEAEIMEAVGSGELTNKMFSLFEEKMERFMSVKEKFDKKPSTLGSGPGT